MTMSAGPAGPRTEDRDRETTLEETGRAFIGQLPPTFDNLNDHRRYLRERLAGACRIFGRAGFSLGLLGHMTVRDPEDRDTFWANPIGVSFSRMKASDVVHMNHAGDLLEGSRPINPVGLLLHAAIHRARPEVMAVCHDRRVHQRHPRVHQHPSPGSAGRSCCGLVRQRQLGDGPVPARDSRGCTPADSARRARRPVRFAANARPTALNG